ncbi:MAG TPA: hypothetical protein VMY37_10035 [Thermoguttaceae bacterium]|nr:hypothetical protein [Thermoguttaceae bacterium]
MAEKPTLPDWIDEFRGRLAKDALAGMPREDGAEIASLCREHGFDLTTKIQQLVVKNHALQAIVDRLLKVIPDALVAMDHVGLIDSDVRVQAGKLREAAEAAKENPDA